MAGKKKSVAVCVNCGKVSKDSSKKFKCPNCGCEVAVVVPYKVFVEMVESGVAKG